MIDGETGQGVGFTPYSPQTTRSKKACVSSCGVKEVQWPYPPATPGTERWTSQSALPLAATFWAYKVRWKPGMTGSRNVESVSAGIERSPVRE